MVRSCLNVISKDNITHNQQARQGIQSACSRSCDNPLQCELCLSGPMPLEESGPFFRYVR